MKERFGNNRSMATSFQKGEQKKEPGKALESLQGGSLVKWKEDQRNSENPNNCINIL